MSRKGISEKDFQSLVIDLARRTGWLCYHVYDSRRSEPGFPDLTMVRGRRVIFAELKTAKGRLSVDQVKWGDELTTSVAEYYVLRPDDWSFIRDLLSPRNTVPIMPPPVPIMPPPPRKS